MKDFTYWPKGARWPWYPELSGRGEWEDLKIEGEIIERKFQVMGVVKEE